MTMSVSLKELSGAGPNALTPFAHMRRVPQPPRDRAIGLGVTIGFHIAVILVLVVGIHVARPALLEKPVEVEMLKTHLTPPTQIEIQPQLVKPTQITAPMPLIDIAPAPNAIAAAPPKPAAPVLPPAPAMVGEGRDTFLGRLLAQLNRVKHYPPEARRGHIEGVVMLHFTMDRDGKVLAADIYKSSGHPALDREALALVHRAEPLPTMPASMPGATFDAVTPVEFSLHDGPT